jgi:hypothetical protein
MSEEKHPTSVSRSSSKLSSGSPAPLTKMPSKLKASSIDSTEENNKVVNKGRHIFLVCVDGSEVSYMALDAMLALRRKYDVLVAYHAYDSEHPRTENEFRPNSISLMCETKLVSSIRKEHFMVFLDERHGQSFMTTLQGSLSHHQASFLKQKLDDEYPHFVVFGATGRKGVKENPTMLGSNVVHALNELRYPCIIIKKPVPLMHRKFIYAVNNSEQSKKGLDILLTIVGPRDSLELVHMYDADSDDAYVQPLKKYFDDELFRYGPVDSKITIFRKDHGKIFTTCICEYVEERVPDFFAIAPRAKQGISSVSNHVVNHITANIVLCKI